MKVARTQEESGKGSFWRVDPSAESAIFDSAFKRKRKTGRYAGGGGGHAAGEDGATTPASVAADFETGLSTVHDA